MELGITISHLFSSAVQQTKVKRDINQFREFLYDLCQFWALQINSIIKRPARDACLCMGELPAPPAPHFVFLITL